MARYFTLSLYFHSPLAHENKLACSVKYFTISHSDSFNEYYIYICIKDNNIAVDIIVIFNIVRMYYIILAC